MLLPSRQLRNVGALGTIERMFESAWRLVRRNPPRYARSMTVSAHEVAAELRNRLPGLGIKKQHKLLYYCQGHHLATFGEPLFSETLSAWDMGPVVGALWHQEKVGDVPEPTTSLTEAQRNTIGYVASRYGALSGSDLERLTHSEPPWQQANAGRTSGTSAQMPLAVIREYFASADDDESWRYVAQPFREMAEQRTARTDARRPSRLVRRSAGALRTCVATARHGSSRTSVTYWTAGSNEIDLTLALSWLWASGSCRAQRTRIRAFAEKLGSATCGAPLCRSRSTTRPRPIAPIGSRTRTASFNAKASQR